MLQALLDVGGIPMDRKTKDWGRRMIYTLCTWRCAMQKHLTHFFQLFSTMGGPGGKSSAHMAAFFGNLGALQLFLSASVDVNAKSMYNKQAPLLYGHVELASRPGGGAHIGMGGLRAGERRGACWSQTQGTRGTEGCFAKLK